MVSDPSLFDELASVPSLFDELSLPNAFPFVYPFSSLYIFLITFLSFSSNLVCQFQLAFAIRPAIQRNSNWFSLLILISFDIGGPTATMASPKRPPAPGQRNASHRRAKGNGKAASTPKPSPSTYFGVYTFSEDFPSTRPSELTATFGNSNHPVWQNGQTPLPLPAYWTPTFACFPPPIKAKQYKPLTQVQAGLSIKRARLLTAWNKATITTSLVCTYLGSPNQYALYSWVFYEGMFLQSHNLRSLASLSQLRPMLPGTLPQLK